MKKKRIRGSSRSFDGLPKIYRTMKLICLFMFVALFQVSASVYSQSTKLNIVGNNLSLQEVFAKIEDQSEFSFIYNLKQIDLSKRVNVDFQNQTVDEILDEILEGTNITYTVSNRLIVVHRDGEVNSLLLLAETPQNAVSGKVTDETGEPLPGVTVIIKGTTNGTVTNIDGNYTIPNMSEDAILVFSFVGMLSQNIPVGTQYSIDVTMKADAIGIEEVVAVGYGVQKKVNLTGSIGMVEGDEMAKQPITLASEALQGLTPGVTVSKSSGAPGSGATIRIRGLTTFGQKDPLVLVDGIQGDLNSIDPNDIEAMSVLKDAASASIYGSRGANGVILITTKRAKKNQFSINYKGWVGVDDFTSLPNFVGAIDYLNAYNLAHYNDDPDAIPPYSEEYIQEYATNMGSDPDNYPNTNWQDVALTGSGIKHNHYVGVTAGTEKLSSRASFSYLDQEGLIENNTYKSYTVRVNNDYKVKKWISIGMDVNGRYSTNDTPTAGLAEIFTQANRIPSIYAAKFSNGKYGPGWNSVSNPLALVEASGNTNDKWYRFNGKLSATIKPLAGLTGSVIYSPTYTSNNYKSFARQYELYESPDSEFPNITPSQNELVQKHANSWTNNFNAIVTYDKSVKDHNFSIMVGHENIDYYYENMSGTRLDYLFPDYQVLNAGAEEGQTNGGTATEWALSSQFGRLTYNYKGKYLFEANARRDGSSRFTNERWKVFPSFSGAWRVSEESFAQNLDWLDNLKLRASWGRLGNQNVGDNYPFMTQVELDNQYYIFGETPTVNSGGAVTTLPNSYLTWEYTETSNIGADISVLEGLFSLTAEYYIRNTSDIIASEDVAEITGLNGPKINAYSVRNKGYEFSLRHRNAFGGFNYEIGINYDDVKNEVTDLYNKEQWISGNTISVVGESMWSYYLFETDGLLQEGETHDVSYQGYTPVAGDIKYIDQLSVDTDGDGIPDAGDGQILADNDRVIKGNSMSRHNYSFDINMSYKIFDLSLFFQGVGKKDILFTGFQSFVFDNSSGNVQDWQMDYWTPENTGAYYPNFYFTNRYNFTSSAYWLRSGAYLRLKNVQLGVNVPKKILQKWDIEKCRFFFSGQNLLTFDKMPDGWDPETSGSSNYPIVKTLSFGVDVTF